MALRKPRYKFLTLRDGKVKSLSGNVVWKEGEWQHVDGVISTCFNGLHCSVKMFDAFSYISDEIVARVEVKGKHESHGDKEAWSDMRLIDVRQWRKEDSVALSIYAAELCLKNFEKLFPNDDRPRKAIEAAAKWLEKPTEANRKKAEAARSAAWSAAWSAAESAAESAARSAAWSAAESAAWSAAESAAWSAAESAAESAAWSAAESAAWSAAYKKTADQVNKWMEARFDELPKYEAKK